MHRCERACQFKTPLCTLTSAPSQHAHILRRYPQKAGCWRRRRSGWTLRRATCGEHARNPHRRAFRGVMAHVVVDFAHLKGCGTRGRSTGARRTAPPLRGPRSSSASPRAGKTAGPRFSDRRGAISTGTSSTACRRGLVWRSTRRYGSHREASGCSGTRGRNREPTIGAAWRGCELLRLAVLVVSGLL